MMSAVFKGVSMFKRLVVLVCTLLLPAWAQSQGHSGAKAKLSPTSAQVKARASADLTARLQARAIAEAAAQAAAQEATLRTQAERERLLVEAEGRQAVTTAENNLSELASQRQVQIAKIESLPKVVAEMVKPAEKIDSIRINQLSGFGQTGSGDATKAPVNQAIDALLGMAVQLPALKKLGNDIGLNFEDGIASINDVDPEK